MLIYLQANIALLPVLVIQQTSVSSDENNQFVSGFMNDTQVEDPVKSVATGFAMKVKWQRKERINN